METLFGVHFLKSEHSTGTKHRGRIDSLGIDETGSPVIFEYKRSRDENVINQGLFYLDWLLDHQPEEADKAPRPRQLRYPRSELFTRRYKTG
jgi:hypothetical protein